VILDMIDALKDPFGSYVPKCLDFGSCIPKCSGA
ncbi:hypothetical protein A2U01_0040510, partial [Trifolium medium]|nr:hypothetical protein [Trifolium medium]